VWRNRLDGRRIRFLITIFTATEDGYERHEEVHEQRLYEIPEITAAAATAGFDVLAVKNNYSMADADESTLRQTWLLRKSI
jgi:hypothetical protein